MPAKGATRSQSKPSVAIIGAGVIGLAIGWRLAQAGCRVDVFDAGRAGHGASWAAAGMLAAGLEAEPGEERSVPAEPAQSGVMARLCGGTGSGDRHGRRTAAGGHVVGRADARRRGAASLLARFSDPVRRASRVAQRRRGAAARALSPSESAGGSVQPGRSPGRQPASRARAVRSTARGRRPGAEECPVEAVEVMGGRARGVRAGERRTGRMWSSWRRARGRGRSAACQRSPSGAADEGADAGAAHGSAAPLLRHVLWRPRPISCRARGRPDRRRHHRGTRLRRRVSPPAACSALLEGAWRALPGIEELAIDECGLDSARARATMRRCWGRAGIREPGARDGASPQRHPADAGDGASGQRATC